MAMTVSAQVGKYDSKMVEFKKQDSISPPKKGMVLLIGSSSFTKWTDVQSYFPDHSILNRGFGGSTLPLLIAHSEDVIFRYKPKQILVYCGDNDLLRASPQHVLEDFQTLYFLIRERLGKKVNITYVSIKPSPRRKRNMQKTEETNRLIEAFLNNEKNTGFINIYDKMLDNKGDPNQELFLKDNLHMNAKGYKIWQGAIAPKLK